MFLFLKIEKYYMLETLTWHFSFFFPLSKSNQITTTTRTVWEKPHVHDTCIANHRKASQTSIASRQSTKERKECKLTAVRRPEQGIWELTENLRIRTVIQRKSKGKQDEWWKWKERKLAREIRGPRQTESK